MAILEKVKEEKKETNRVQLVADWFASQKELKSLTDDQIRGKIREIGAFIDSRADRIETILHLFSKIKTEGIGRPIEIVITEFNGRKNALNKNNSTPVRIALVEENVEAFEMYVKLGADLNGVNVLNETIDYQLEKNGQEEMLALLRQTREGFPIVRK